MIRENDVRKALIGNGTEANPDVYVLRGFLNKTYFGQLEDGFQVSDEYRTVETLVHELLELWYRVERKELIEERQ